MDINLQWQIYLCDETKYQNLYTSLARLTKWYISTKYDCLKQDWQDLYHDLVEKVIKMKNNILSGKCKQIKNFKSWYYFVMKNHLIDEVKTNKRKLRKLKKYKELLENEAKGTVMEEREILERLASIMAIQNNPRHVEIFVEFVKGVSYNELAVEHGLSKENVRKIIERMRKECRRLWESEKIEAAKKLLGGFGKEAAFLFGAERDEAMVSLVERLKESIQSAYVEYHA